MTDEAEMKKAFNAISETVMDLIETKTDGYAIVFALLAITKQLGAQPGCGELVADALEALRDREN